MFGQKTIEIVGEFLLVALAECSGSATHLDAARTHGIEEVPHVEPCANILGRMQLASRAERMTTFLNDLGRERDVTRDNEIACVPAALRFRRRQHRNLSAPAPC